MKHETTLRFESQWFSAGKKQPVPTAVNEGNHMKKMRAVLIGRVPAAVQVASAPVSADAINCVHGVGSDAYAWGYQSPGLALTHSIIGGARR